MKSEKVAAQTKSWNFASCKDRGGNGCHNDRRPFQLWRRFYGDGQRELLVRLAPLTPKSAFRPHPSVTAAAAAAAAAQLRECSRLETPEEEDDDDDDKLASVARQLRSRRNVRTAWRISPPPDPIHQWLIRPTWGRPSDAAICRQDDDDDQGATYGWLCGCTNGFSAISVGNAGKLHIQRCGCRQRNGRALQISVAKCGQLLSRPRS